MAEDIITTTGIARHGATRLPSVDVDSFNIELKDDDGFLGDRASKGAFREILDTLRKPLKKNGDDPLGSKSAEAIGKNALDEALVGDDIHASALVHGAIEQFAQELAYVTRRFSRPRPGRYRTYRGGRRFSAEPGRRTRDRAYRHHSQGRGFQGRPDPDSLSSRRSRLIGCLHLAPSWISKPMTAFLASISAAPTSAAAWSRLAEESAGSVEGVGLESELWRHADDEPTREGAVKRLVKMLKGLIAAADAEGLKLAPFIGSLALASSRRRLDREGRAEPAGNWESSKFNLPASLVEAIPQIGDHDTAILMHNDGRGAGPFRGSVHAGRRVLGCADHRHRPRQCVLHQPQEGQRQG